MSREISYLVRHVVTLPDTFPTGNEPTVMSIEECTNAAVWSELIKDREAAREDTSGLGVTTRAERLDK